MAFKQIGPFGAAAAALLISSALASTASAATVYITDTKGVLSDQGASFTSQAYSYRFGEGFSDQFVFDLSGPARVYVDIATTTTALKGLRFTQFQLFPVGNAFTPPPGSPLTFSFDIAQSGSYAFIVYGMATGTLGGSYHLDLYTQPLPVPEPATIALSLSGLALVGALARRKRA